MISRGYVQFQQMLQETKSKSAKFRIRWSKVPPLKSSYGHFSHLAGPSLRLRGKRRSVSGSKRAPVSGGSAQSAHKGDVVAQDRGHLAFAKFALECQKHICRQQQIHFLQRQIWDVPKPNTKVTESVRREFRTDPGMRQPFQQGTKSGSAALAMSGSLRPEIFASADSAGVALDGWAGSLFSNFGIVAHFGVWRRGLRGDVRPLGPGGRC